MLAHYEQTGELSIWPLWGNETGSMIGYHAVSVIADAWMKGIRGFDGELALEAMIAVQIHPEKEMTFTENLVLFQPTINLNQYRYFCNRPMMIGVFIQWQVNWEMKK